MENYASYYHRPSKAFPTCSTIILNAITTEGFGQRGPLKLGPLRYSFVPLMHGARVGKDKNFTRLCMTLVRACERLLALETRLRETDELGRIRF